MRYFAVILPILTLVIMGMWIGSQQADIQRLKTQFESKNPGEVSTQELEALILIALRDHPEIESLDWIKVMDAMAKRFAKPDPEKALLILSERFAHGQKKPQKILGEALIELAKKDHEAVIQWLQENEMNLNISHVSSSGVVEMIRALAGENLENAMSIVLAFESRNSETLMRRLASSLDDTRNVEVVMKILGLQESSRRMRKSLLTKILQGPLGGKPLEFQAWLDSGHLADADREFVFYGLNGCL